MNANRIGRIILCAFATAIVWVGALPPARADFCEISWQANLPVFSGKRYGAGAVAWEGRFYLFGGQGDVENAYFADCRVYDPDRREWSLCAGMPAAKGDFGVALIDGRAYAVGGKNDVVVAGTFQFNLATDQWSQVASYPIPVAGVMCAGMDEGLLYCFGGMSNGITARSEAYAYDPAFDQWSALAPMPFPKAYGAATLLQGQIYITGGWEQEAVSFRYDPQTDDYQLIATPAGRNRPALAAAGELLWLTTGGNGWQELSIADERFTSGDWGAAGTEIPDARIGPAAAFIPGYGVLLAGGCWSQSEVGTNTVQLWRTCIPENVAIEPSAGEAQTILTITGDGFEADQQVLFADATGELFPLSLVSPVSENEISAEVPAMLAPGIYDLVLIGSLGQRTALPAAFTLLPEADDDDTIPDDDATFPPVDDDSNDDDSPDAGDDDHDSDDDDSAAPPMNNSEADNSGSNGCGC